MTPKKTLVLALVVALCASLSADAVAGKKKKKKKGPKPYTSEEGMILVPHTMLVSSTGEVNSVTAKEFENRCEIPASNGLDAYVYEVPRNYQKIEADIAVKGAAQMGWQLYAFFYDENCARNPQAITPGGTTDFIEQDAEGIMPAGTAYVLVADFLGSPATVHYELKPTR